MRNWYKILALATGSDVQEISIYDGIGMWGVTAQEFNADLKKITAKEIKVTINSPGGSLFDALAMYNGLRNHGAKITTKVMGIAASAASVVFMAGDNRIMPENTFLMVHNCIAPMNGNADEHREFADLLDTINESIVTTYMARTGKTEEEVRALLDDETYMSAAQSKDLNFTDVVEPALKVTAEFELDRLPDNVQAVFKAALAAPVDPANPSAQADPAFADQVSALAAEAGLAEYATVWALVTDKIDDVKSKIANAREVKALCALAKRPEDAAAYIRASKPLADVRTELCAKLAEADEASNTDTSPKGNPAAAATASPVAVTTGGIWAKRRENVK